MDGCPSRNPRGGSCEAWASPLGFTNANGNVSVKEQEFVCGGAWEWYWNGFKSRALVSPAMTNIKGLLDNQEEELGSK